MSRTLLVLGLIALLAQGCAGTGGCIAPHRTSFTPAGASTDPTAIGQVVTWGGTLVKIRNLPDTTELEILAYPLNSCGTPETSDPAQGRFIARWSGFLDPADFRPGRSLTVTGRLIEVRSGTVGDAAYRFPVLEAAKPELWPLAGSTRSPATRPVFSIGIGSGGYGHIGGGVGVTF